MLYAEQFFFLFSAMSTAKPVQNTTASALQNNSVLLLSLVLLFSPLDVPFTFDQQHLTLWIYQGNSE